LGGFCHKLSFIAMAII
jgi:hypothetical protein